MLSCGTICTEQALAHRYRSSGAKTGLSHMSPNESGRSSSNCLFQAGNFVREEILSAFIRLVAHTPELQAYTASKLYLALKSDISQESLTLAATWILGEYSDIVIQGGIVDDDQVVAVSLLFLSIVTFPPC